MVTFRGSLIISYLYLRQYFFPPLDLDLGPLPCAIGVCFCRQDFVGDLITSALKRPPHVPARDGSIGPPALSKLQQLLRFWHELLAVGYRPALFHSQVVNRQHVGATEIKY